MKNRRIILSLLLSILLVLLACACSDNAGDKNITKTSATVDEPAQTETTVENNITYRIDKTYRILYFKGKGPIYQQEWVDFDTARPIEPYKIVIGRGATLIGDYAFSNSFDEDEDTNGLDLVEEVIIPDTVTQIGREAFGALFSLKRIDIPNSVTWIGDAAFTECTALKKVKLPSKLEEISPETFYDCKKLKSIEIPKSVKIIGKGAFMFCYSLKEVELSSGLKTIKEEAFMSCSKLREVIIPKSVTKIEEGAFDYCDKLTIKGYKGTAAEKYAKDNKFKFIEIV